MPPFTLWAPFTQVRLELTVCTWSVPSKGQRLSNPYDGALGTVWPDDCAVNPEGKPKLICGRRLSVFEPGNMRASGTTLPCASFKGRRLLLYRSASVGVFIWWPRVMPHIVSRTRFGLKV